MDALDVFLIDLGVALTAGGRDLRAWLVGRANIVSAVAVCADGSIQVARFGHLGVHAVLGFLVIGRVAFLAGLVIGAGHLSAVLEIRRRMGVGLDLGMAGFAFDAGRAVHRAVQIIGETYSDTSSPLGKVILRSGLPWQLRQYFSVSW